MKKLLIKALVAAIFLLPLASILNATDYAKWMKDVPDNALVYCLDLP